MNRGEIVSMYAGLNTSPKSAAKRRIADVPQHGRTGGRADGLQPAAVRRPSAVRPSIQTGFYRNGVGWVQFFLAESQSRLYPHMHATFGRDPTAVSKKVPFNFICRCIVFSMFTIITSDLSIINDYTKHPHCFWN